MRLWWDAAYGVVRRDAILFFSYRTQVVTQIFSLLFSLTLFYYISRLLRVHTLGTAHDYFAFVVVGLVIMQSQITTLGLIPGSVRQELVAGTLERFLVSRFGALNGIAGMMLFPTISAFLTGIIMLVLANVVFGLHLAATAPLAIPVAMLGSVAFAPLTFLLVATVVVVKQAAVGTQFVIAGISIVGGLYFPISELPGWVRWASDVQPFTPAADALRHLLVGTPLQYSLLLDIGKLVGFALLLLPVSLWILNRAIGYAQRRGTIIEY
ncbi:MAG TPA: ABC transporter permease [Solirubrobacteraceae bacterium]